ncbi:MAG: hypothetical protein H6567_07655 [Lewinellaceae bacterium]|nr:hypothetical protein [Lewinellaceae bacterium]
MTYLEGGSLSFISDVLWDHKWEIGLTIAGGVLVKYLGRGLAYLRATKTSTKLLNQFNSAESLIEGAGNLTKVKAGMQGFVKGDGPSIFKAITNGGTLSPKGYYTMPNGTVISKYFSSTSGDFTIFINQGSNAFKIRIIP